MLESELWSLIKRGLDKNPLIHSCRVESTVGTGMSDVNTCRAGVERWIELKVSHGNWLHFRNSQRGWIARRTAAGGVVLVLARHIDSLFLWNAPDLLTPDMVESVDDKSFKVSLGLALPLKIDAWSKPYPWSTIADEIFRPRAATNP
jgi:hypothetical protein